LSIVGTEFSIPVENMNVAIVRLPIGSAMPS